eukprot:TRINITY_DN7420_c0_g1_i1.p1 TRINITY_DN7420_c0_g1~~TRINITY_DN7420_c0_g1_i1.p1  ORF type:complete len:643 (+),score=137.95 TRINITY_DN7420_c0_g1_i1:281-2209(+)
MALKHHLEPVNIASSYTSLGKSSVPKMASLRDDDTRRNGEGFSVDAFLSSLPSFAGSNGANQPAKPAAAEDASQELVCPPGCQRYTVTSRDTVRTIAVRFAMSTSELMLLNRLGGEYVYPGQVLLVKDGHSDVDLPLFSDARPSPQASPRQPTSSAQAWFEQQLTPNNATSNQSAVAKSSSKSAPRVKPRDPRCTGVQLPPNYLADDELSACERIDSGGVVVHAMYVTDGEGFTPGLLQIDNDLITFRPDDTPLIRELGPARFIFQLDCVDLLKPRSQAEAPDFRSVQPTDLTPSGKFHDPTGINRARSARIAQSAWRRSLPSGESDSDHGSSLAQSMTASVDPDTLEDGCSHNDHVGKRLDSTSSLLPDDDDAGGDQDHYPMYLELRLQLVFGEPPRRDTVASYWLALSRGRIQAVYDAVDTRCSDWQAEWDVIAEVPDVPATSIEAQAAHTFSNRGRSATAQEIQAPPSHIHLEIESKFVTADMVAAIVPHLPPWQRMLQWRKLYTTHEDGISLKTLYRRAAESPGPNLLFVRDRQGGIFGAYLNDTIQASDKFYGNGKSFLFRLAPEIEFYKWTGDNGYILMGNKDSLVVGGGGGFAIWLDESFDNGSSNPSSAFNNPTLATTEQFKIQAVEVWTFVQV